MNLGFVSPNLGSRILHSSNSLKLFPFNQEDKSFDDYLREWLTGGPLKIFTRYAKAGTLRIKNSSNMCETIVAVDASQFYPFSMAKIMPTEVYTKRELCEDTGLFNPQISQNNYLECIVLNSFQKQNPRCYFQTQLNQKSQTRIGVYSIDCLCSPCNTNFEMLGCYCSFCPCHDEKRLPIDDK